MGAIAEDYEDRAYAFEPEYDELSTNDELYTACLEIVTELPAIAKSICDYYEREQRLSDKQRKVLIDILNS